MSTTDDKTTPGPVELALTAAARNDELVDVLAFICRYEAQVLQGGGSIDLTELKARLAKEEHRP